MRSIWTRISLTVAALILAGIVFGAVGIGRTTAAPRIEYQTVVLKDLNKIEGVLNARAVEGWELAAAPSWWRSSSSGDISPPEEICLIFKRPKQ